MRAVRVLRKLPRWAGYAWPHSRRALVEPRYGLALAHAAWALWREGGWRAIELGIATSSPAIRDYGAWVRMYGTPTARERERMRAVAARLPDESFPEVIIQMDSSTDARAVHATLESLRAQIDPRSRAVVSTGSSADALNTALAGVRSSCFLVVRAGDRLAAHALARLAVEKALHPGSTLIYADEDRLVRSLGRTRRGEPCFKPDWSPELALAVGGVGRPAVLDTAAVRAIGGFDPAAGSAAELDLILRVTGPAGATVRHVPEVLLHGEKGPAPPNLDSARAISLHLRRTDRRAVVALTADGYRLTDSLPSPLPSVTLVMPTRDAGVMLAGTVRSLLEATAYPDLHLVVVDNDSKEPAALTFLESLATRSRVQVLRAPGPFNFAALINAGVKAADTDLVAIVNNDLRVLTPDWLTELVGLAAQPDVGAAGPRLWYPDGTLQHGGIVVGLGGVAGHDHKRLPRGAGGHCGRAQVRHEVSALTGACLVLRRDVFLAAGGLDASALPVAFNDVDLCLRLRASGLRLIWTPHAELEHLESATRGAEDTPDKVARFESEVRVMKARWGELLIRDPYYNPNLTLDREDYSLAWPPRRPDPWALVAGALGSRPSRGGATRCEAWR
jgi:GT2 family glycosyltransferase